MKKLFLVLFSIFFINSANAGDLSKKDMEKAWDCVGIYMANYFLPSGETFEYSMKEKSISSVKVWKAYALEIGIKEKDWDEGANKAVDKHYGSKYDKELTDGCHAFLEKTIGGMKPDKSGILFKVSVHNEAGMKEFVAGNNPKAKAIYAECVDNVKLWELSKVEV